MANGGALRIGDLKDPEHPAWKLGKHPAVKFLKWIIISSFLVGILWSNIKNRWEGIPKLREDVDCLQKAKEVDDKEREYMKRDIGEIKTGVNMLTQALLNRRVTGNR